ncbi:MAG: prolyl oligopeptidase family serine peptidase [Pseudomonadota bacterium]
MARSLAKYLVACAVAAGAAWAQAGVGLAELPGLGRDGPVTVFYPAQAQDETVRRGPFTLRLAPQAQPVRGNGRLVVISHGSGGNPWVHTDLARTLVDAGFVVALPEHRGDNSRDFSDPGPASWKLRPAEVSRAIDIVAGSAQFSPLVDPGKVGVYGGSAGGHTALAMAGGRWSPAAFRAHCQAHIEDDFSSCVGFITRLRGNGLDGIKKAVALGVIGYRFDDTQWYSHADARVRAAVASVPFAADFDFASFSAPRIPLGLVTAGKDINQVPRFHSGAVLAACKACERVADLPTAGHGAMLSPMPPMEVLGSVERELLGDPPGFDRAVLPEVDRRIAAFFVRHLLP